MPANRRVLVVDDEKLIANTMALILSSKGHQTKVAYDGLQAIEVMAEFSPEIVISDVVMPKMNGVDFAVYLSQHYPRCKVLLMSGNVSTADIMRRGMPEGLEIPLVNKPVHPQVILEFVELCT